MTKEETLTENKCYDAEGKFWYYKPKDVKEKVQDFLKELKDEIKTDPHIDAESDYASCDIIDKLAKKHLGEGILK